MGTFRLTSLRIFRAEAGTGEPNHLNKSMTNVGDDRTK